MASSINAIVLANSLKIKSVFQQLRDFADESGMNMSGDPLYTIFEQHLMNALVEEESTEEFVNRVVQDYIAGMNTSGVIARSHLMTVEEDLREEVLEMLKKKTYGHYSLKEFREAQAARRQTRSRRPM